MKLTDSLITCGILLYSICISYFWLIFLIKDINIIPTIMLQYITYNYELGITYLICIASIPCAPYSIIIYRNSATDCVNKKRTLIMACLLQLHSNFCC